ncbi:MAG: class I SAM-dependent methyltransferase [Archaeoglobus sp.]|nr:class I SAM-dependent methyltransferase [Archaeoglobus sp.]
MKIAGSNSSSNSGSIEYSDGSEDYLLSVFRNFEKIDGYPIELQKYIKDWPTLYNLSYLRTNILSSISELFRRDWRVLDCGAGTGALTLWLAKYFSHVDAVEGNPKRIQVLKERAKGYSNIRFFCGDITLMSLPHEYELITLIGVLEYIPYFSKNKDKERVCIEFLKKLSRYLNNDGILVIAIENKLGLKYICGCAEEHSARIFDGLIDYPRGDSPITFSKNELENILQKSGFKKIKFYYVFPDYKLPICFIKESEKINQLNVYNWITDLFPDYFVQREFIIPDQLFLKTICKSGLIGHFSNSFLILASKSSKVNLETEFLIRKFWNPHNTKPVFHHTIDLIEINGELKIRRKPLINQEKSFNLGVVKFKLEDCEYVRGESLIYEAFSALMKNDGYTTLKNLVMRLYEELIKNFGTGEVDDKGFPIVSGEAIDFTFWNIIKTPEEDLRFIDRKWTFHKFLTSDFILFRNLFYLFQKFGPFIKEEKSSDFIIPIIKIIHPQYDFGRFLENLKLEKDFQSCISIHTIELADAESKKKFFLMEIEKLRSDLALKDEEIRRMNEEIQRLSSELHSIKSSFTWRAL